jgi:hypothetical protein
MFFGNGQPKDYFDVDYVSTPSKPQKRKGSKVPAVLLVVGVLIIAALLIF